MNSVELSRFGRADGVAKSFRTGLGRSQGTALHWGDSKDDLASDRR